MDNSQSDAYHTARLIEAVTAARSLGQLQFEAVRRFLDLCAEKPGMEGETVCIQAALDQLAAAVSELELSLKSS